MTRKLFSLLMLTLVAFALISCTTETDPPVQSDVYVAGEVNDQAVLWVNGEAVALDTSLEAAESKAIGLYDNQGTLYIIGNEFDDDGDFLHGVYWTYDGTNAPVRYELTGDNVTNTSGIDGLAGTLYISGCDYDDKSTDSYDDDTSDAVYWIVSANNIQQKEALTSSGEYYTNDIVLNASWVPQIIGFTPELSDEIRHWADDGGIVSVNTYTGLSPYDAIDIEVDESGGLNILGNLSGDIMFWVENDVRPADPDPFTKTTIHDGTGSDEGQAFAFDANGNVVIAGQIWDGLSPVAKCWVYDGSETNATELGEGFGVDVAVSEGGEFYVAGHTYNWEACYWIVDTSGNVTQHVLEDTDSSKSHSILLR